MMLVMVFSTAIAFSSCKKDDVNAGSNGMSGQIWVNYDDEDTGIYEYLQFERGTLKRCLACTRAGMYDIGVDRYDWSYTSSNGGWYIAVMSTYPYTVISSTTIMSFNGQLIEISGNTMRRGDIIYKRYKQNTLRVSYLFSVREDFNRRTAVG